MNTYELTNAARLLADEILHGVEGDPERDAVIDAQVLAWIDAAGDKGEAIAAVHRRLTTEAAHWRAEAARLTTLARRADRSAGLVAERATQLVQAAEAIGGEGARVGPLRLQRNAPSVVIDVPDALPPSMWRVVREPNKAAIKAAIDAGNEIPGARLTTTRSIRGL